jgi:hypothetical protein
LIPTAHIRKFERSAYGTGDNVKNATSGFRRLAHLLGSLGLASTALFLIEPAIAKSLQTSSKEVIDTRAFISDDCVFALPDSNRSAVVATLVGSALKAGLNRLGSALRSAGSEKTFTTIRSTNTNIALTRLPACVYIVQGKFLTDGASAFNKDSKLGDTDADCKLSWTAPFEKAAMEVRASKTFCAKRRLAENGIFLSEAPGFFFEGKTSVSTDKSALAINASVLHLTRHLDASLNREGAALVLSFALAEPGSGAPGADALSSTASVTQLAFGKLKAPVSMMFTGTAGPSAPWLGGLGLTKDAPVAPRVFWAARSETRDPREFLLFLADTFDGSKEAIATDLQQTLLTSERRKAELSDLAANAAAASAAESKWAEAQVALGEYADLSATTPRPSLAQRQQKSIAIRSLQREANILASTAALAPYFPMLLDIPTN